MNQETAGKMAEWWASKLRRPTFSPLSEAERKRPDSSPMLLAQDLAGLLVQEVTDEQLNTFKAALVESLFPRERYVSLRVDYHPDMELSEAAAKAGISAHNFPWKSGTSWDAIDGKVIAYCGYGSEGEVL